MTTTSILVVEDDPAIHELVRFTLEGAGFDVVHAADAEQAIQRVNAVLPDVALIDWMLPGMSGLTLAQRLRAQPRTKTLPIIMVTARAAEGDRVAGLEQGADDYITKPFSPRGQRSGSPTTSKNPVPAWCCTICNTCPNTAGTACVASWSKAVLTSAGTAACSCPASFQGSLPVRQAACSSSQMREGVMGI